MEDLLDNGERFDFEIYSKHKNIYVGSSNLLSDNIDNNLYNTNSDDRYL